MGGKATVLKIGTLKVEATVSDSSWMFLQVFMLHSCFSYDFVYVLHVSGAGFLFF